MPDPPQSKQTAPARRGSSRRWTPEEDSILREVVINSGGEPINWVGVSKHLLGRSNKDTRRRWTKIRDDFNRGAWSQDEDNALRRAVEHFGQRWALVTDLVETRSPDQCQKRWRNALDPKITPSTWSVDNDQLLLKAVNEMGKNWAQISDQYFPQRSPLSLSNRHAALQQRRSSISTPSDDLNSSRSSPSSRIESLPTPTSPVLTMEPNGCGDEDTTMSTDTLGMGSKDFASINQSGPSSDWLLPCPDSPSALIDVTAYHPDLDPFHTSDLSSLSQNAILSLSNISAIDGTTMNSSTQPVSPFQPVPTISAGTAPFGSDDLLALCTDTKQESCSLTNTVLVLENLDQETREEVLRLVWSRRNHMTVRVG